VRLRCTRGGADCAGRYRLATLRGAKSLATVRYSIAAGRTSKRVLALSAARRAALERSKGRVRVYAGTAQVARAVVRIVR
jgi:hypothetical protein